MKARHDILSDYDISDVRLTKCPECNVFTFMGTPKCPVCGTKLTISDDERRNK